MSIKEHIKGRVAQSEAKQKEPKQEPKTEKKSGGVTCSGDSLRLVLIASPGEGKSTLAMEARTEKGRVKMGLPRKLREPVYLFDTKTNGVPDRNYDQSTEFQARFAGVVYEDDLPRLRGCTLFIDEGMDVGGETLNRVYKRARHLQADLVLTSQRPVCIPRVAVSCATHAFFATQYDKRDKSSCLDIAAGWHREALDTLLDQLDEFEFARFCQSKKDKGLFKVKVNPANYPPAVEKVPLPEPLPEDIEREKFQRETKWDEAFETVVTWVLKGFGRKWDGMLTGKERETINEFGERYLSGIAAGVDALNHVGMKFARVCWDVWNASEKQDGPSPIKKIMGKIRKKKLSGIHEEASEAPTSADSAS